MQTIRSYLEKALKKIHGDVTLECCIGCFQAIPAKKLLKAPCGHQYCPPCLRRMASTALDNLELFPPKCCRKEIPPEGLVSVMSFRNKKRYIAQSEEQAVPPQDRVYCPRATCGRWIHPKYKRTRPGTQVCPHCRAKVCSSCRGLAHGPWPCSDDESLRNVLKMAKENKWQRCPSCHYVVEKVDGCNYIYCRCKKEFCYACGGLQSKCKCHTHDPTEELAGDGDLDVDTLVAAMEQADIEEDVQEDDEAMPWTEEPNEEVGRLEVSVGRRGEEA